MNDDRFLLLMFSFITLIILILILTHIPRAVPHHEPAIIDKNKIQLLPSYRF